MPMDWNATQPILIAACTAGATVGAFLGTVVMNTNGRLRDLIDIAVRRTVSLARAEERRRIEALERHAYGTATPRRWSTPEDP